MSNPATNQPLIATGIGSVVIAFAIRLLSRYFTVEDRRESKLDGCESELKNLQRAYDRQEFWIRSQQQNLIVANDHRLQLKQRRDEIWEGMSAEQKISVISRLDDGWQILSDRAKFELMDWESEGWLLYFEAIVKTQIPDFKVEPSHAVISPKTSLDS